LDIGDKLNIAYISTGSTVKYENFSKNQLKGTENQIYGLSKSLSELGNDITIYRRWINWNKEFYGKVKVQNIKSFKYEKPGIILMICKLVFSLKCLIYIWNKRKYIDYLFLVDPYSTFFLTFLKIKKVIIIHNQIPLKLSKTVNDLLPSFILNYFLQKYFFGRSNYIITLNKEMYANLSQKYNCMFIPNGIELNKYKNTIIVSKEKKIMYGGRFVENKGIQYLIHAYNKLSEEKKNEYKLLLVGEGEYKNKIISLVKQLSLEKHIEIKGWLDSDAFIEQIKSCEIFVLPSLYETFGIVLIEAMALKKIVIASNVSGPKTVIKNGYNGFLFNKGDISSLYRILKKVTTENSKLNEIKENAYKTVIEYFTFNKVAEKYIKLLNNMN